MEKGNESQQTSPEQIEMISLNKLMRECEPDKKPNNANKDYRNLWLYYGFTSDPLHVRNAPDGSCTKVPPLCAKCLVLMYKIKQADPVCRKNSKVKCYALSTYAKYYLKCRRMIEQCPDELLRTFVVDKMNHASDIADISCCVERLKEVYTQFPNHTFPGFLDNKKVAHNTEDNTHISEQGEEARRSLQTILKMYSTQATFRCILKDISEKEFSIFAGETKMNIRKYDERVQNAFPHQLSRNNPSSETEPANTVKIKKLLKRSTALQDGAKGISARYFDISIGAALRRQMYGVEEIPTSSLRK